MEIGERETDREIERERERERGERERQRQTDRQTDRRMVRIIKIDRFRETYKRGMIKETERLEIYTFKKMNR